MTTTVEKHESNKETAPDLWSESGAFARYLATYEQREQQQSMYEAVLDTLQNGGHLIVEAGTGTGKGMAYLTAIMLMSQSNPETRFVVSTNTINLQQQLVEKDIPQTLQALTDAGLIKPDSFTYTLLKGKSNYLCQHNLQSFQENQAGRGWTAADSVVKKASNWNTTTGDRAELNLREEEAFPWSLISAQYNSSCPYYQAKGETTVCYLHKARQQTIECNLTVTNHALFMADIANHEQLLGRASHIILDESHHLEEQTSNQFGWKMSEDELQQILKTHESDPVLSSVIKKGIEAWKKFWDAIAECAPEPQYRDDITNVSINQKLRATYEWTTAEEKHFELKEPFYVLQDGITQEVKRAMALGDPYRESQLRPVQEKTTDLLQKLEHIMDADDPDKVQWLERAQRKGVVVHNIPLNVAPILRDKLFSRRRATILTSATLTTEKDNFQLIRNRIGFPEEGQELALSSPFNYKIQAQFMSPADIPGPKEKYYGDAMAECLEDIAIALDGHTLALFTSHASLNSCAKKIREKLEDRGITVMAQGRDGTPASIVERFRSNPRAIILGAASFWEGIDLTDGTLKAVAICRLPFPVPTDPIIEARSRTFKDPFNEYHTPLAILRFRQGCGRLVRDNSSKGSIIILDNRIRHPKYGMKFHKSLPNCQNTRSYLDNIAGLAKDWVEI